jgi:hypothetical protein
VRLLDDPEMRAQMGAFGRRRVDDELEWRHEAPRLLAAYEALESIVPAGRARRMNPGAHARPSP